MKAINILIIVVVFSVNNLYSQILLPKFSAEEAMVIYYNQGFDSETDFKSWDLKIENSKSTWHLVDKPYVNGLPSFTTFNPNSKSSLAIRYNDYVYQNELITSPALFIKPNSYCKLYSCFSGGLLVFARWKLLIENVTTNETVTLFDAFVWSQQVGYDGPGWMPFEFDLSEYTNQTVRFTIQYIGSGGEDVLIDDFQLVQKDESDSGLVKINEGDKVHFKDLTMGNPDTWFWEFEGGSPESSNIQNPVVTYNENGVYNVKLTVTKGVEQMVLNRDAFVDVRCVAPKAIIGLPEQGYLSPWVACYVPLNQPLQFKDLSLGKPTSWHWQFPGSNTLTSSDQHPVISYNDEGINSLSLRVQNAAGTHEDILQYAIQSGGSQYIWNILPEENSTLDAVNLGFYGYYGGSNYLGMSAFAEYYTKPLVPIQISSVDIYFASTTTVTPDALITVSINKVHNGLPGEAIVSATLLAKDLKYSETDFEETTFSFKNTVEVNDDYFVVISGFPNNVSGNGYDEIAMFAVNRKVSGGKSTVYHRLDEWDMNDQPTGNAEWFKNHDESVSFAITPLVSYNIATNLRETLSADTPSIYLKDRILYIGGGDADIRVNIYSIDGILVLNKVDCLGGINLESFEKGVYIVEYYINDEKRSAKIGLQ